ncbi:MAG TPA: hypothetical protein V6D18_10080 [Thermosynechococcaceae cyanobacterium]
MTSTVDFAPLIRASGGVNVNRLGESGPGFIYDRTNNMYYGLAIASLAAATVKPAYRPRNSPRPSSAVSTLTERGVPIR